MLQEIFAFLNIFNSENWTPDNASTVLDISELKYSALLIRLSNK